MTNNKKLFRFITIIFFILATTTAGIIYFAFNISDFTSFGTGTSVGGVYIGGLYPEDAKKEVRSKIDEWSTNSTIHLVYQDHYIPVDTSVFEFYENSSVNSAASGKNNLLYVVFKETHQSYIQNLLLEHQNTLKFTAFDKMEIETAILNKVSSLHQEIYIDLGYYVDKEVVKNKTVNQPIELPYAQTESLIYKFENTIQIIEIKGNKQFSLVNYFKTALQDTAYTYTDQEMSIIATGIFTLIIDTNFINIDKSISEKLPTGINCGYEAYSSLNKEIDLTFYNPNAYSYYIMIEKVNNNRLVFTLKGAPFVDQIYHTKLFSTKLEETVPQEEIIMYRESWNGVTVGPNEKVPSGENGYDGARNKIIRHVIKIVDGQAVEETYEINFDYYAPKERIMIMHPDNLTS